MTAPGASVSSGLRRTARWRFGLAPEPNREISGEWARRGAVGGMAHGRNCRDARSRRTSRAAVRGGARDRLRGIPLGPRRFTLQAIRNHGFTDVPRGTRPRPDVTAHVDFSQLAAAHAARGACDAAGHPGGPSCARWGSMPGLRPWPHPSPSAQQRSKPPAHGSLPRARKPWGACSRSSASAPLILRKLPGFA